MLIISIRESEKEKLLKRHNFLAFHLFSFYLLDILHPFLTPLPQYNLNPFFLLIRIKSQTILIHMTLWVFSHSPILSRHQTIPNQVLRYVKCSNNFKLLSSTHEMTPNQLPIPEHINMAGILLKFNHCESGMVI